LIIARHKNGCVAANACIDLSNAGGDDIAVLLPVDADRSARRIAEDIFSKSGARVAVIINDSLGRAWRAGTTGTAIGAYGLATLQDRRGAIDRAGNVLQSSEIAIADEAAGAASLLMGQGDEGLPIAVIRGLDWAKGTGKAADLVRPPELDLFR
jgi:coenzyme F420-0:L-glutamate ligase / coenzyme F420-1:gamma-L-glutamate ligase